MGAAIIMIPEHPLCPLYQGSLVTSDLGEMTSIRLPVCRGLGPDHSAAAANGSEDPAIRRTRLLS